MRLSLADARRVLLSAVQSLPPEEVPLPEASGRIVQGTVVARVSLPPEDHATVDGYAVRVGDIGGGRGEGLRLAGTVTAGLTAPPPLLPGYCMAITTGAPLPPGTEAVIPVEAARRTDDVVLVASPPLLRALHGWTSPLPAFRARLAEPLPPAGEETLLVAGVVRETAAGLEFHRRGQGWRALGMLAPCPAGSDPDPHITVEPFPAE